MLAAEPGRRRRQPGHADGMTGDFSGEVASFCARYRRGYPAGFTGLLARALRLGAEAVIADICCGTGLLTIALAGRARAVAGVDPEPDMLAVAAASAAGQGVTNVTWVLGSDETLPALAALAGGPGLDAVTVANAIRLMPEQRLFGGAMAALRSGGGIAVIANGTLLWQQASDWSRALRLVLGQRQDADLGGSVFVAGCLCVCGARLSADVSHFAVGYWLWFAVAATTDHDGRPPNCQLCTSISAYRFVVKMARAVSGRGARASTAVPSQVAPSSDSSGP